MLAPLNAIRAFEAVARTGSYARAARELHVTPAAVGQLVRGLEDDLGQPLFHRKPSGASRLVLTAAARRAASDFRAGFETIQRGLAQLRAPERPSLTITASQAFVSKWLMARLDDFTAAHPGLDVKLDVSDRLLDLAEEADVGIRCGAGVWPGLRATRLMDDEVFPVAAPSQRARRLRDLADPEKVTRIHDVMQEATGVFPSWSDWLARAGVSSPAGAARQDGGLRINSSVAAIQAAISGHGVALARARLVEDDLAQGRLVRLVPEISYPVSWAYYLVRSAPADARPHVRAFRDWLVRSTAGA